MEQTARRPVSEMLEELRELDHELALACAREIDDAADSLLNVMDEWHISIAQIDWHRQKHRWHRGVR